MKFGRYLKDTQTPEWKKAYIDYSGLKKRINAIRNAQQGGESAPLPENIEPGPQQSPRQSPPQASSTGLSPKSKRNDYGSTGFTPPSGRTNNSARSEGTSHLPALMLPPPATIIEDKAETPTERMLLVSSKSLARIHNSPRLTINSEKAASQELLPHTLPTHYEAKGPSGNKTAVSSIASPRLFGGLRRRASRKTTASSQTGRLTLPLAQIIPTLAPSEKEFIEHLDRELDKVETFYRAREWEALVKASTLREQIHHLKEHRRRFYESQDSDPRWTVLPLPRIVVNNIPSIAEKSKHILRDQANPIRKDKGKGYPGESSSPNITMDPDEYKHARKELKKAILEYYRGLELLTNYRVLNLTGFRKALKKFEKVTRIHIQPAYMREKVEPCTFAAGEALEPLVREMEDIYAEQFEHRDKKRAMDRLKLRTTRKTHYFSLFRAGLFIGAAIPALVSGLYQSFQANVRAEIPWNSLLLVYGTCFMPILLALLIGVNVLVWSRRRINYVFILELDLRSKLDSREYFELPAFFLFTMCYAFWLSFSRIGSHVIASTTWPIVWIVFSVLVMFNPFPFYFHHTRRWLLKKIGMLLLSGTQTVEFTDFWLGDLFCSLLFPLSNIYFIACAYNTQWQNSWVQCGVPKHWVVRFTVASLPLIARAVQSVKRYYDSRLYTHLINGGKYTVNWIYYLVYFIWRHHSTPRGGLLALYICAGVTYSIYTAAWDLLMDWSFFKKNAKRPFLRPELIYDSYPYVYYWAIVSDVLLRFVWVIYVPVKGPNITLRTFIAGCLEVLRRFQWNFFRLENEHVGNTDQYRVTREVPLPYSVDEGAHDSEDENDDDDDERYNDGDAGVVAGLCSYLLFSAVARVPAVSR